MKISLPWVRKLLIAGVLLGLSVAVAAAAETRIETARAAGGKAGECRYQPPGAPPAKLDFAIDMVVMQ